MKGLKNWLLIVRRIVLILCISIGLGVLALISVYALPKAPIINNVRESVCVFEKEGNYPDLFSWCFSKLDNFTDALMLLSAAYNGDENVVEQSMQVFHRRVENQKPSESLIIYYGKSNTNLDDSINTLSYARYWHGYLIFLKPLLYVLNYQQIRWVNLFCQIIIDLIVLWHLKKYDLRQYILPYILAVGSIMPIVISYSIQFSSCFYIFSLGVIILIRKYQLWKQKEPERFIYFFLILGILTSYFDLLTYPMATLGMPLVIHFCFEKRNETFNLLKQIFELIKFGICWGIGYIGMWSGKWIVSTLLCDNNVVLDAFRQISVRSSMNDSSGECFGVADVLMRNAGAFVLNPIIIAVILYMVYKCIIIWKNSYRKRFASDMCVFGMLCIMPFVWYLLTANHAYIHFWFTYKALMVSVFSVMCMLTEDNQQSDSGGVKWTE